MQPSLTLLGLSIIAASAVCAGALAATTSAPLEIVEDVVPLAGGIAAFAGIGVLVVFVAVLANAGVAGFRMVRRTEAPAKGPEQG